MNGNRVGEKIFYCVNEKNLIEKQIEFIIMEKIMKIEFFLTDKGMDERATKGGIYHVELIKDNVNSVLSLYIGESVWMAARCGEHLYSFYDDPSYFGLTKEDLENDELILRFSVLEGIQGKKSVLGVGTYKDKELKYIQENNPITQLNTSDRQLSNVQEKVRKVQIAMKESGLKL